ncbi:glycosyl hydrolase [Shewanella sp. Choline-02u-19]|uniref:lysozyme n=1 Tax=unclassified Shewanella TaxID=196818 RepID=UPI000C3260B8|nr:MULTISPECIES: lysozyme [unclassified Shewanella]PKH62561.1 glycosyl hydrolase [Shewanella sp. Bg11-22]PKI27928.1 glycosyl hydrolase [Shewanella sp. Choline-02u-19]
MNLSQKLAGLGLAAAVAFGGAALVIPHEGQVLETYVDPVGILTSCYGHTGPELKPRQTFTDQQCLETLADDLSMFDRQLLRLTYPVELTLGEHAAYLSFIYNVGAEAFRTSTLRKKLLAQERLGACHELPRWVYAKGKKLPGLIKRREAERKVCLKELIDVAKTDL